MKLIDLLNSWINDFNATFICVIHENPGFNNKARGHLGTEIRNKASYQIQIAKEAKENDPSTEVFKISYKKIRIGKRPNN